MAIFKVFKKKWEPSEQEHVNGIFLAIEQVLPSSSNTEQETEVSSFLNTFNQQLNNLYTALQYETGTDAIKIADALKAAFDAKGKPEAGEKINSFLLLAEDEKLHMQTRACIKTLGTIFAISVIAFGLLAGVSAIAIAPLGGIFIPALLLFLKILSGAVAGTFALTSCRFIPESIVNPKANGDVLGGMSNRYKAGEKVKSMLNSSFWSKQSKSENITLCPTDTPSQTTNTSNVPAYTQ